MLDVQNLHVSIDKKAILKGLTLQIKAGEVHVIMGTNGSGKTTFANVLAGHPNYLVTQGSVTYLGQDLLALSPEQRAHAGLFLGFQYPVEIPGVSNIYFLKSALNANLKARGQPELDAVDFLARIKAELAQVGLKEDFLYRSVNEGFSGGEKKRNEMLQLAILAPKLAILDETDSGLDIDSLKIVAAGINRLRSPDHAMLIITHYQRLLHHIVPDQIHILHQGSIVKSGKANLADKLEKLGYAAVIADTS
jgi:Fe-S cluster assembly ATP-binding protein